mgnify:FL=1
MTTVFLDTNILISGIFFSGREAELLKLPVRFITSDINVEELREVTRRKFRKLHIKVLSVALKKIDDALYDIDIVHRDMWQSRYEEAGKYISGSDQKILAAVLYSKPDYFVTGDKEFFSLKISEIINVIRTTELLERF